jgi:hypothetical protein
VQLLSKASDKLRTSVGDYHLQNSVQAEHASDVDPRILLNIVIGVDGYEVVGFGESMLILSHFYSGILSGCNSPTCFI